MARVYSTLLARGTAVPGAPVLQYTVPAGYRAVLKHVQISPAGASPGTLCVLVNGSQILLYLPLPTGGNSASWAGTQVLNAGDTLSTTAITNSLFFFLSGFLLTLP